MIKINSLEKTTYHVPTKQGKDIYSPIQSLVSRNKISGIFTNDKLELSTYSKDVSSKILKVLNDIKAKYMVTTEWTD